ncbi:MAG: glycosyltransferase family protein [Alphaproteobacteria bacterium]|nr:glycosyltransferase family protein [Alphaproteobacteria bacterium]
MLVIVQARLSSSRLPGKVLKDLGGRPMLAWTLERVCAAKLVSKLVVATSTEADDDAVADFCAAQGVTCHRGPLDNVAERFALAIAAEKADAFLRITGDAPLIDPAVIDAAIRLYQAGEWDLVSNVLVRSFPIGQSVEILRSGTFVKTLAEMADPGDREHVTQFLHRNRARYRTVNFSSGAGAAGVQMSVDTPEDFDTAQYLIAKSGSKPGGWRDLLALLDARTCSG